MNKKLITLVSTALLSINAQADTLSDLQKCANTKDSLVRLVCYDNVMKSLNTVPVDNKQPAKKIAVRATQPSSSSNDVVPLRPVAEKAIVKQSPKSVEDSFGGEQLKKVEDKNALEEVIFTIQSVEKDAHKKWRITFENGQVWSQSDNEYLRLSSGNEVVIAKGMLGSFYLKKVGQNKRIRVKRKK